MEGSPLANVFAREGHIAAFSSLDETVWRPAKRFMQVMCILRIHMCAVRVHGRAGSIVPGSQNWDSK